MIETRKGQIHVLDLAVWIMVVSSLFLLIAPVIDISSAVSESKTSEEISETAIMYSSEILMTPPILGDSTQLQNANKIGLVKNERVSAQLSKEFIDMCMFSHEKTRGMLGLYHTNSNLDYSVKIWYPTGELVGECTQNTNAHGLVVNRYGLDENNKPIIITLEVYEVE